MSRRGSITLMAAGAMIVAGLCLALVVDHVWVQCAHCELQRSAEASALAAARELATDDLLDGRRQPASRIERARQAAARMAARNPVAGESLVLKEGDVRFDGRVRGPSRGLCHPMSIAVHARRSRSRNNPVALFLGDLTGQPVADVSCRVEATLCNLVSGLRPVRSAGIPFLPLLPPERAQRDGDTLGWQECVEDRQGEDRYGFDADAQRVVFRPDGICELTLTTSAGSCQDFLLCAPGSEPTAAHLTQLLQHGVTTSDLDHDGGVLRADPAGTVVNVTSEFPSTLAEELKALCGDCRVMLLADQPANETRQRPCAARLVAARVMAVETAARGVTIVLQPGVLITRAAVVEPGCFPNPYIYKLEITRS